MFYFLADENFNNETLRGIQRRVSNISIIRVQDTELQGKSDDDVLAWAAAQNYIVLTHDVNTLRGLYYERLNANLPIPGLFLVHSSTPIADVIESLELIVSASLPDEWAGDIRFLPF